MLDKKFEELRLTGKLPSPTGVGLRILQITQRDDVSLEEVASVLQTDPTLTGRLLKLANSGANGGRSVVTTAQAAAVRLGMRSVRNISLGFSLLANNRAGRCQAFDYDGFWSHSLAVAAAAQAVADLTGDVVPTEAFTCGLLQGMGRLALASIHPTAYGTVLERARGQTSSRLAEIEQENFGTHHREVASAMLKDWRLPQHFCDAVAHVGSGAPVEDLQGKHAVNMARTLQDARDLARALTADVESTPEHCRRIQKDLVRLRARLELGDEAFAGLWARVAKNWASWGEIMSIRAKTLLGADEIQKRAEQSAEPLSATEAAFAPDVAPTPREPSRGLRICLVGEELTRTADLRQLLESDGHRVTVTADGRDGLKSAIESAPHLVLCDWDAPRMDALALVRTLRQGQVGGRLHFLVVAEGDTAPRLLEAFEAGVDECLVRPFDPRIVVARARAVLRYVQLDERVEDLLAEREAQIGQLAILTRKLQVASITDPLTGVHNRRFAIERLGTEFEKARADGRPLSVITFDLDRFKSVNDTHGHDAGDAVLRETSRLAASLLRRSDSLCRMGGEEFLAICPGADLAAGVEIAERLRTCIRGNHVKHGTFDGTVTVSLGVAQVDEGHADVDALLKCADRRVYSAKESGRDRTVAHELPELLRDAG